MEWQNQCTVTSEVSLRDLCVSVFEYYVWFNQLCWLGIISCYHGTLLRWLYNCAWLYNWLYNWLCMTSSQSSRFDEHMEWQNQCTVTSEVSLRDLCISVFEYYVWFNQLCWYRHN